MSASHVLWGQKRDALCSLLPLVQSVSRDFYENRSNCDKSVKFGTKLHNMIINQNRPGHK